ncbi:IniB N-terminal domain-containing protein [Georgenia thermotolerans]|uniref:Uncharacterized protein n=1 Tax=Georgenia thermotolerans TaxID=527326 RepID=A0A7J5UJW9_9MICO|nr:IniB N-terminal domain-containing protein [Georgenia thermotolerans]KAE8762647.1 hypothetical protein GB883_18275 [Georgenia thermotolerans]
MTTIANALLEFLMQMLRDPDAAERFREDPHGELHRAGLDDVHTDDVDAVLPVVLDYAPMRVDTSFQGAGHAGGGTSWGGPGRGDRHQDGGRGPEHTERGDDDGWGGHGDDDHGHAVTQLTHIVNSYAYTSSVDDRDTVTDQAVHQNVWADGDVLQWFDNDAIVATGDGAIAAGGDVHVDAATDGSTNLEAHDAAVEIGTTDLDVEDSFDDDHVTDGSEHSGHLTEDAFDDGSDRPTDVDLDLTDAFDGPSPDVDVDLEDSFTPDDVGTDVDDADLDDVAGAGLTDADLEVDASDGSTHDAPAAITDDEIGTADVPGSAVVAADEAGSTEDALVVHDSFDETFSDSFTGTDVGPDGLGDVPS